MAEPLCIEYVDLTRDIFREIYRNKDRGQNGVALKQYLPVPRWYRNHFGEDRTWVMNLLKRTLLRLVADHVLEELPQNPIIWNFHPEFDPKSIDVVPPSAFNWLAACRTEAILSQQTLEHLERLRTFMRTRAGAHGSLALKIGVFNSLHSTSRVVSKKRPSQDGIGGLESSAMKRQRPNESSSIAGEKTSANQFSMPAPILPPIRQPSYAKADISHLQARSSMTASSTDPSILGRLLHLEKIVKRQSAMVESSNDTVSELDDCLAELIAKCTERKDQARIVAQKVENLEKQMSISPNFTQSKAYVPKEAVPTGSSLIDAQSARILTLENMLLLAEKEKKAYRAKVAERFQNLEARMEAVLKNTAQETESEEEDEEDAEDVDDAIRQQFQHVEEVEDVLENAAPVQKPLPPKVLTEASPFRNSRIVVEIRSAKRNSS